ncbi:hypothetical protein LINGRAHAP2_LOCUS24155 [Linum grandiflorum]
MLMGAEFPQKIVSLLEECYEVHVVHGLLGSYTIFVHSLSFRLSFSRFGMVYHGFKC